MNEAPNESRYDAMTRGSMTVRQNSAQVRCVVRINMPERGMSTMRLTYNNVNPIVTPNPGRTLYFLRLVDLIENSSVGKMDLLGLLPDADHWQDIPTAVSKPVSRGTLNFLEHARRQPVKSLVSVKVSQEVGEELEKLLRRFTDFHLSHKLKTLVFMEKMGF